MAAKARNTYGRGSCVEVERGSDTGSVGLSDTAPTVPQSRRPRHSLGPSPRPASALPSEWLRPGDFVACHRSTSAAEAEAKSRTVANVLLSWLGAKDYKTSTYS